MARRRRLRRPRTTTILGAAKLTGRLASERHRRAQRFYGRRTRAHGDGRPSIERLVAPRTAWGVARVEQEFGREASTVGFGLVTMRRDLDASNPLASLLTRSSVTAYVDTSLRFGNRTYEANFSLGVGRVAGEPAAIERVQRSAVHLFQVPDRPVVHLDPTRTSLNGLHFITNIDKVAGRHGSGAGRQINHPASNRTTRTIEFRERYPDPRTRLVPRNAAGRFFRAYPTTSATRRRSGVQAASPDVPRQHGELTYNNLGRASPTRGTSGVRTFS